MLGDWGGGRMELWWGSRWLGVHYGWWGGGWWQQSMVWGATALVPEMHGLYLMETGRERLDFLITAYPGGQRWHPGPWNIAFLLRLTISPRIVQFDQIGAGQLLSFPLSQHRGSCRLLLRA